MVTIQTADGEIEVDVSPWLPEGQFPTKDRCNPNNPGEAFLWTYVGLPGQKGAPLAFPTEYLRMVSQRQWDCGARPADSVIPPEVTIKYQRPKLSDPHWLTAPGVWVDIDEPDRDQFDLKEFVQGLPQDARRQLAAALGFDPNGAVPSEGELVDGFEQVQQPRYGKPSRDGASVSNDPLPFDPLGHTVDEVRAYLRNADPEEQDRVITIERNFNDSPRSGILKRYKGVGL
ncbi:phage gene 29 protein family protein [Nocardia wallacei]|uniref:phage gene 29 protein family protein n=1 Tax=Nocardia wallacei TaxID=480035 RepID=UPI0024557649|nr:DUF2744 domain-containing protein [Nocardia wallacei]